MKRIVLFIFFASPLPGFAQSGPAGVGKNDGTSTLEYWVNAGSGVTGTTPITTWTELSGNGITNTINGNTSLNVASINGQNAITFDGIGDFIQTNLSINAGSLPNLTIIAVYKPRINNSGGVWGEDNGGWDRFMFDSENINASFADAVTHGGGPVTGIPNIFPVGLPVITTVAFKEDIGSGTTVYANGTLQSTYTSNHAPESSNNFQLGAIGTGNYNFDGDIAEIIIYSTSINEVERILLDNYLAAKYGILLTSTDLYTGDNALNGNYDFEVAGIGRTDASNIQNAGQGSGAVKIMTPSGLDDNEFLIWGHDNNEAQATNTTDIPVGVQARFNRSWRVSEVNSSGTAVDVGSIDMEWDLSGLGSITAADLRLLVDTDNDGLFANETPISGATLISGNIYAFTGVTAIVNNLRFTIATTNSSQTPLPITLANFNAIPIDEQTIKLEWETTTEVNSDFFEVLRSMNGTDWEKIIQIPSKGSLSQSAYYSETDNHPYPGTSYYRLRQTDVNRQFIYSTVRIVERGIQRENIINVFPNPSHDIIAIEGIPNEERNSLMVLNPFGENLTYLVQFIKEENSIPIIDLSKLPSGIYMVKTKTTTSKLYKL